MQLRAATAVLALWPDGERSPDWRRFIGRCRYVVGRGGCAGPRLPNPVRLTAPSQGRSLRSYRPVRLAACRKSAVLAMPSPPDEGSAQSAQAVQQAATPMASRKLAAAYAGSGAGR